MFGKLLGYFEKFLGGFWGCVGDIFGKILGLLGGMFTQSLLDRFLEVNNLIKDLQKTIRPLKTSKTLSLFGEVV